MAKRFTETDKWKDPWFRRLTPKLKSFWEYLRDNCDSAGFWKVDIDYAIFHVGELATKEEILYAFNEGKDRILDHGSHWELVDFLSFQYGRLSEKCNPHIPIINLLEKYENKGYRKGKYTLMEQEKEEDKEKEKEGVVRGRFVKPSLEEVTALFTAKGHPAEARRFFDYFDSVGWVVGRTHKPMKSWRGAVATWVDNVKTTGVSPEFDGLTKQQKAVKKQLEAL